MCAQLERETRGESSKEQQGGDQGRKGIPTTEEFLCHIVSRVMRTSPPKSWAEHDAFLDYLQHIRLVLTNVSTGSVIITVICTSLEILEALWKDCNTGHMDEVAQKLLITNDVIREFGNVKITVTILEEEYIACRAYFVQLSGKPKKASLHCFSLEKNRK